jgi:TetR/AcrR family transcriptional repressor for divergent bdcA
MTTKNAPIRGRPRKFDPDAAVEVAQRLFHERGYDGVSIDDVTRELGVKPPSFYAAFGSKAGLYDRVLRRYTELDAIPFERIMRPDRPVAEAMGDLLEEAARRYAAVASAGGCLVVEGLRSRDDCARNAAKDLNRSAEDAIRTYVAARHPAQAAQVVDFVATTMFGLSAKARDGHTLPQLLATARMAANVVARTLAD